MKYDSDIEALQSRRAVLKMLAASPLLAAFGMASSPLMRFLKPTMNPFGFFQPADFPAADLPPEFELSDFPDVWTCFMFMLPLKWLVFNPEQYEIRKIPGFIIRVEENRFVAFSRICPLHGLTIRKSSDSCTHHDSFEHYLSYVRPADNGSCGCCDRNCKGDCIGRSKTPVLICPRDGSVFDVRDGSVLLGPSRSPARQFVVEQEGDILSITRFVDARIVV
ncbi:MAG: hypothetical protein K2Z81_18015 [Cyanobacteria bacterium]|nr:hypothetical protein [Cyanobacteriota bacterium]